METIDRKGGSVGFPTDGAEPDFYSLTQVKKVDQDEWRWPSTKRLKG
jgi:hypothetical protein